jgi:mannitol/fructose-specific phosphotransferase system IIA component (Ntr-type)
MKQTINELIQLQDLNYSHLKDLEKSIDALSKDLPKDICSLFQNLLKHYSTAVVPMADGICTGCGMAVPTILAYEVKVGDKLIQCPRCTRIIYYRDALPRQLKRINSQHPKPSAGISRFSSNKLMIPDLNGATRDEILSEMINLMAKEGFVEKPESLLEAAIGRELIVSTAIEHGLAFPHVRGIEGGGLILAAGLKKQGLHFGAPKNRLSKIIFFIVIPLAASAFYLQLIAGLMETFREADSREKIMQCKTSEKMWNALIQLTKKTIS